VNAAADSLVISEPGSGIFTGSQGSGLGGDLLIQVRNLQLTEDAAISAQSSGSGNAGTIRLVITDTFLSEGGSVTTEAAQASGGNIEMIAQDIVRLQDSLITATVRGGPGTVGGNIIIDAEFVIMENSQIVSNAFRGRGGDISITAEALLQDSTSVVSAIALDSEVGIDGEVDIRAPIADLSETVTALSQDFKQAAALLRQRCAERLREGEISSFVLAGRDGVPLEPDGLLPDPLVQEPPIGASLSSVGSPHHGQVGRVQSRGWPEYELASVVWDAACGGWLEERKTLSQPVQ
jgi:hypothetical protein